jgi:hypothetical protein
MWRGGRPRLPLPCGLLSYVADGSPKAEKMLSGVRLARTERRTRMYYSQEPRARRRREFITLFVLALIVGGGIFLFAWLITGAYLLALFGAVAALALLGAVHYVLWGRELSGEVRPPPEAPPD